jgi:DNA (cytosine-5)-methyltransferase 1
MPTFGSLFAGIGGIDLGLERAGWECRWQVEWDEFCQHVLAHHWPDVPRYGDISAVDWSAVERVDLLAGGFPCQPVSGAGRRLAQDDARWLWPEFLRAVRALRPRLVLVENVPGLLERGMDEVLGGLAASGYDAEWDCVPAAAVGAPHLRDRLWIVAHAGRFGVQPDGRSGEARRASGEAAGEASERQRSWDTPRDGGPAMADAAGERPSRSGQPVQSGDPEAGCAWPATDAFTGRFSGEWGAEPDVGRVAHGVPARVDRLRALGNAVVPQVVEVIGRQLLAAIEDRAA